MRRRLYAFPTILTAGFIFYLIGCNSASDDKKETTSTPGETKAMTKEDMMNEDRVARTSGQGDQSAQDKLHAHHTRYKADVMMPAN